MEGYGKYSVYQIKCTMSNAWLVRSLKAAGRIGVHQYKNVLVTSPGVRSIIHLSSVKFVDPLITCHNLVFLFLISVILLLLWLCYSVIYVTELNMIRQTNFCKMWFLFSNKFKKKLFGVLSNHGTMNDLFLELIFVCISFMYFVKVVKTIWDVSLRTEIGWQNWYKFIYTCQ